MGLVSSTVPLVADLGVQFTMFAMTFNMIIYSKGWKGWYFTPLVILLWQVIVRTGGEVQNPLQSYAGQPAIDANLMLNTVWGALLIGYSWLGWAWMGTLGGEELFPLRQKLPKPRSGRQHTEMIYNTQTKSYSAGQVADKGARAPKRVWGVTGLSVGWAHLGLTALYLLGGVCVAQVIYDQYMMRDNGQLTAFLVLVFLPLGVGLIYWGLCYLRPDPRIFGLTRAWFREHGDQGLTPEGIEQVHKGTQQRVIWTIVPILAFTLVGDLVLGGVRYWSDDVNNTWIAAISIFGAFFVLWLLVELGTRMQAQGAMRQKTKPQALDDDGDYYEDMATLPPTVQTQVPLLSPPTQPAQPTQPTPSAQPSISAKLAGMKPRTDARISSFESGFISF